MDGLDRQQGEKFHAWAKRTQEYMQFYYSFSYIPYPKSNRVVNNYIGCIRRLRAEPNLYRCSLCKERWDRGHDVKTLSENRCMHDFICSSTYFYSRYTQKATAIQ